MSRPSGSKSRVIILFFACATLAAFYFVGSANKVKSPGAEWKKGNVIINNHQIEVFLAQTDIEKENGLSGFDKIKENQGMLFIFDVANKPGFWMKDMKFPIDIIWINNNQVVDITKNLPVQFDPDLTMYFPTVDVDRALEVNAGWTDKNEIKVGDEVEMNY